MDRYSDVVQNENGRAVPDASIQIIGRDGTPAIIYADRQGAKLDNPLITDELGRWSFCAADGIYTAKVYLNGVLKATLPDIRLEDPDNGIGALTAATGAALVGTPAGNVQSVLDTLTSTVAGLHNYTLTPATTTALGGVKVGNGLAVDSTGTLTATGIAIGTVAKVNAITPDGSGNVAITTDNLPEGASPVNQWFTAARVRNVLLTGLSTATNAAAAATDTLLDALGKLQAQIGANTTAIASKDATGGYAGLTGFAINIKNAAGTIVSKLTSVATVARTIVFPDKDGTVALLSDIPVGGSMVFLGSAVVSTPVAQISFLSLFTSACDKYVIELEGIVSAANSESLKMQVAEGGVLKTNLYYGAGTGTLPAVTSDLAIASTFNSSVSATTMTIEVRNANGTAAKSIGVRGSYLQNAWIAEGRYTGSVPLSGFSLFLGSGGNFTAGTVRVYGIKNS